eukprot:CAMPEP_0185838324 /NCGR_PEP_ID=MMETSP1353-20130828/12862_1 /TAXON_ID=1077150 /ORGANISM="Erythrolobus australicus, Strain CCMP3124" /LENGTH=231 /DNA_ID=CAMNT_0028537361 /DNA_START=37 /DNA_END=729 /DNA_ORIENTATION=-
MAASELPSSSESEVDAGYKSRSRLRCSDPPDEGEHSYPKLSASAVVFSREHVEDVEVAPGVVLAGALARHLHDYQLEGVRFLARRLCAGSGALLADDMGLGKTVQVACLLAAFLQPSDCRHSASLPSFGLAGKDAPGVDRDSLGRRAEAYADGRQFRPVLIVAPASLLCNWRAELERWAPFSIWAFAGSALNSGGSRGTARDDALVADALLRFRRQVQNTKELSAIEKEIP